MAYKKQMGAASGPTATTNKFFPTTWSAGAIIERLIGACLAITILLPLFILPFNSALDFSKQWLLVTFVGLAMFFWIAAQFFKEEIIWRWGMIHSLVATFFLTAAAATWFSAYQYGSLVGVYNIATSFLIISFSALLFFLLSNRPIAEQTKWVSGVVAVGSLVGLILILRLFGLPLFWWQDSSAMVVSLAGSVNDTALYLALLIPLLLSLASTFFIRWTKYLVTMALILILICLHLVALPTAWYIVVVGTLIWFILAWLTKGQLTKTVIALSTVVLVVAAFSIIQPQPIYRLSLPAEVNPSFQQSLTVATSTLQESTKNLLLGRGPSLFGESFSHYRPAVLNYAVYVQSNITFPLWSVRFTQPANFWLNLLADFGILGSLSFLLVILGAGWLAWQQHKNLGVENSSSLPGAWSAITIGLWATLIAIIAASALRPFNVTTFVLFWICLGLLAASTKTHTGRSANLGRSGLGMILLAILFLVGILWSGTLQTQRLLAEFNLAKAEVALNQGDSVAAVNALAEAVRRAPLEDRYWRQLSEAARVFALNLNSLHPDEAAALNSARTRVIGASQQAYNLNPTGIVNVAAWASTLQGAVPFTREAANLAVAKYLEAAKLEPTNPVFPTEQARTHLLAATYAVLNAPADNNNPPSEEAMKKFADEQLDKAATAIDLALQLKSDYSPARFVRSAIAVRRGQTEAALKELDDLAKLNSNDAPLHYEIGLLHYRTSNLEAAKKSLETAVKLNPKFSNALYFLGLIADKQDNQAEAIRLFESIAAIDPKAREVVTILDNLRAGREALATISPPALPPDQNPVEPLR